MSAKSRWLLVALSVALSACGGRSPLPSAPSEPSSPAATPAPPPLPAARLAITARDLGGELVSEWQRGATVQLEAAFVCDTVAAGLALPAADAAVIRRLPDALKAKVPVRGRVVLAACPRPSDLTWRTSGAQCDLLGALGAPDIQVSCSGAGIVSVQVVAPARPGQPAGAGEAQFRVLP